MRGPKLVLVVVATLVAAACGRPASPPLAPPGVETLPTAALASARAVDPGATALDALPWGLERMEFERALAENDPRFAPRMDESGPVLETPGSVVATFGASGAELSFGGHETTLRVAAIGRGESLTPVAASVAPVVAGPEVRTTIGDGIVEWWRSLPSGLEHGVTIDERPAGDGELVVEVAVSGDLSAHLLPDDAVELRDSSGERVATYAHLVVLDAGGDRLQARMEMDGERIALRVDDAGARYPIAIDPLVTAEEATLVAGDGAAGDELGLAVALSADGIRALVGGVRDDTAAGLDTGSARVFLRTGTGWAEEATLVAPDGAAGDLFGWSVALSADGSRALVGASRDDTAGGSDAGSARVFLRTGTIWVEEAILIASDGALGDNFGISVALSSDGSRALVGAPQDDTAGGTEAGSARVFLRTRTSWAEEATLLAPAGASADYFGISVALSSDGTRALVGALYDDTTGATNAGSACVFFRTSTSWAYEATFLAPDRTAGDEFGSSVAFASDGSRALVGAHNDDVPSAYSGSAHVFLRTGTSWMQEATLRAFDGAFGDEFGRSVSLSSDGSRALIGAYRDYTAGVRTGSARVFVRSSTIWVEEASLVAPDAADGDEFGYSVSLSADGSRALLGAYGDDTAGGTGTGSARVFTIALAPNGSTCGGDAVCTSGFCVDAVCCNTACGAGLNDCQACSVALGGGANGTCTPFASTIVCRAAAPGVCDVAETCTGTSGDCPVDGFAAATTVCRLAGGTCDAAEACTGTSAACPVDRLAMASSVCRAPAGPCDAEERCDGASAACPGDALVGAGIACGIGMVGTCSGSGLCNGTTVSCPSATIRPAGTVCVPAIPGNGCDVDDVCDGLTDVCRPTYAPVTRACGAVPSDVCDAPDHCAGTSADCIAEFRSGVECRAASGGCDSAEFCAGAAACPPDAVEAPGMACRVSTNPACDPPEVCDGVATSCPADVTSCMVDAGTADAGRSDGGAGDGGATLDAPLSGADAGTAPVATAGCGCRAGARDVPFGAVLGMLVLLAFCAARAASSRAARRRRPEQTGARATARGRVPCSRAPAPAQHGGCPLARASARFSVAPSRHQSAWSGARRDARARRKAPDAGRVVACSAPKSTTRSRRPLRLDMGTLD